MKDFKTIATILIATSIATPAFAQGYHYNYGTSRVINQGGVGYYQHESTYIPTGSINNTAKGIITGGIGQEANPALPGVKWGRTVGTSGDNFYLGGAPDKFKTAVPTYAQTPQRTFVMGGNGQRGQNQRQIIYQQPQQQQQQGYFYVPGQNGGAAQYNSAGGVGYQYSNTGAATYESTGSGKSR